MTRSFVIIVLALALSAPAVAVESCPAHQALRESIAGELAAALEHEKECIQHFRAPENAKWSSIAPAYFANASQVAAQMGRLSEAEDLLSQVELSLPSEVATLSRGYLLEMGGRLDDAKQYYLRNRNAHTLARLAVLAMNQGEDSEAIEWASLSLRDDPMNLTARIVLAALGSSAPDGITARLLRNGIHDLGQNQLMPAYYAEMWWAKAWLEQTGRVGRPPTRSR